MQCFYNIQHSAVGFCKSCCRALCGECLSDLGDGLACKGRCEELAAGIININKLAVKNNPKVYSANRQHFTTNSLLALGVGIPILVMSCCSLWQGQLFVGVFGIAIASAFIIVGIRHIAEARKLRTESGE